MHTHQFSRGHITRVAVSEQVRRQLQGQRTYFFPGGGDAIGWEGGGRERKEGEREGGKGRQREEGSYVFTT